MQEKKAESAIAKEPQPQEEKKMEAKPAPKWKKPTVEEPKQPEEKKVEPKLTPKWKKKPAEEPARKAAHIHGTLGDVCSMYGAWGVPCMQLHV